MAQKCIFVAIAFLMQYLNIYDVCRYIYQIAMCYLRILLYSTSAQMVPSARNSTFPIKITLLKINSYFKLLQNVSNITIIITYILHHHTALTALYVLLIRIGQYFRCIYIVQGKIFIFFTEFLTRKCNLRRSFFMCLLISNDKIRKINFSNFIQ